MGFVSKLKKTFEKKKTMLRDGVYVDISTDKLRQDVEFILHNLPKDLVKGIEILEGIFDIETEPHQIIVKSTMTTIEIKRQIGKFIFQKKRWEKQEEITRKLFAEEKVDLDMFFEIYETRDYLRVYENVCMDVFSVYYGNESMNLDEISIAINSLYIKNLTDKYTSKEQQSEMESFINDLFNNQ